MLRSTFIFSLKCRHEVKNADHEKTTTDQKLCKKKRAKPPKRALGDQLGVVCIAIRPS